MNDNERLITTTEYELAAEERDSAYCFITGWRVAQVACIIPVCICGYHAIVQVSLALLFPTTICAAIMLVGESRIVSHRKTIELKSSMMSLWGKKA